MKVVTKLPMIFALMIGLNEIAFATPIISGDGTETCTYGAPVSGVACEVQTISIHDAWQPNTDAQWISYADTGVNGSTLAPTSSDPIFSVIETFFANAGDYFELSVWADDTAEVFINDVSVIEPNFSQNICADGSIGCEPDEKGLLSYTFLTSGLQTLTFDVYQIGTGTANNINPFGLLYSGNLTSNVPEPSTLLLMSTGLLGIGFANRKRKKS